MRPSKFLALSLLFVLLGSLTSGQTKIHKDCGPEKYLNTRTFVETEALNMKPYNTIVHINVRGLKKSWGTATFIDESTLITARHVADKWLLNKIIVFKNIFEKGKIKTLQVTLNKKDVTIKNAPVTNCYFSDDISLIQLSETGKTKLRDLFRKS